MNKCEEIIKLKKMHDAESGLDTRLYELAGHPLTDHIVSKIFKLKEEMNELLNNRVKELGLFGEFGVQPIDTSHLNDDDFGAYIREEITKEEVEQKRV